MIKYLLNAFCIVTCIAVILSACSGKNTALNNNSAQNEENNNNQINQNTSSLTVSANIAGMDFSFSERDAKYSYNSSSATSIVFSGEEITVNGAGAKKDGNNVIISGNGTFILSGRSENAGITVQAATTAKPQIVLNGLELINNNGPAMYIKSAEKVFLTLADGSKNLLADAEGYTLTDGDTNIDAALFSREDLTINGSGVLVVRGNQKHAVVSKDDLVLSGGTYDIISKNVALNGKDCVKIENAEITVSAGSDGIRSDNEEDADRGYIYIKSGNINITAKNDAIQAHTVAKIEGGNLKLITGSGSGSVEFSQNGFNNNPQFNGQGGMQSSNTSTESQKGIKAGNTVFILGGSVNIDSADDSVHANGTVEISGGSIMASSGDDGVHADTTLNISDGTVEVLKSYEGLESSTINISGGNIKVAASDDGLNAAGGNDSSAVGSRPGKGNFTNSIGVINISGGYILLDALGDGIDSNGTVNVSGGVTLVSGPTSGGNGAFDYQTGATVTGGILIATGSMGMAQGFTDAKDQGAMLVQFNTLLGGTSIALCDENSNVLVSFTPSKQYQSAVITAPEIAQGKTYTLVSGGTVLNADQNGFAQNTSISGGTAIVQINMTSNLYGASGSINPMNPGGGDHGGGPMGGRPMEGRPMK